MAVVLSMGPWQPARAQSPSGSSPSPTRMTIAVDARGGLAAGETLTVRVDATYPGGWQNLHEVTTELQDGGKALETLSYDIEDSTLALGDQQIIVGTGAEAQDEYLAVSGADVVVTTGGANLSLTVTLGVVKALPPEVRFRSTVTDDYRVTATSTTSLAVAGTDEGFGWNTVLVAVFAALLAGAFAGNLVASRRRPPPRLSVYGTIQRRIDDQRTDAT